ncbi:hypothetical protein [Novosphingobium sp. KN65.2]|uniref:hypothetical protein n=1 Tax=Novosphingobium sp. KN65.2 TaxID=1478134 RepID=UPI0005E3EC72|nr:hypothetical protein [Novosphingobium sp. KN65.2]CDO37635.1 hypothetical protein SPHV1_370022 [Novosphingobium sp. KN65.2]
MAKHTHTTFSCDRCKADLGDEQPRRNQQSLVNACFNWREGPGPNFNWIDLCDSCDAAVKAFFLTSATDLAPTQSEMRDARVWWAEVSSYVNRDMAGYIMVRARRMLEGWKP